MAILWIKVAGYVEAVAERLLHRRLIVCLLVMCAAAGLAEILGAPKAILYPVRATSSVAFVTLVLLFMLWALNRGLQELSGKKKPLPPLP